MERVDLCFNDPNEVIETKTKLIRINKKQLALDHIIFILCT